jgi:hypothetical protein
MSMNLCLQDDVPFPCESFELWQTPTHISNMCVQGRDPDWEDIRDRYFLWVDATTNGSWEEGELEAQCELVKEHKQDVNAFCVKVVNAGRSPEFFVM